MQDIRGSDLPTPAALAYLGDAVHGLLVREMLVARGYAQAGRLHGAAAAYVTAQAQAVQAERILPLLTGSEADLYRRAYNSGHLNRPRHVAVADYRAATGWEAVLGALWYLGETDRARKLFSRATEEQSEPEEKAGASDGGET